MKSRWRRNKNEMTCPGCGFVYYSNEDDFNFCPNCGLPMNEEAEQKVPIRWHDAKADPPKDDGVFKLLVLNGKRDNVTFDGAMAVGAHYQAHGRHPSEWDIESNIGDLPSSLVSHWAELPEGPKETEI